MKATLQIGDLARLLGITPKTVRHYHKLGLLAEPDGLLMAAGIEPAVTVSQEAWSLFANVIGYLLVAAFFVIEYAYRRRRFPGQPYRNMVDFFLRVLAAMPLLVSNAAGSHRVNSAE